jgi:hypothetical protein
VSYTTTVTINAPADRVWSKLIDAEAWPQATASMISVERLDHGPFQRGSQARIRQPRVPPLVWTVTDIQPGRQFTWFAKMAGVSMIATHAMTPVPGDGVTLTLFIEYTGALAWLIELLSAGLTKRYINMESAGMKRVCEAV